MGDELGLEAKALYESYRPLLVKNPDLSRKMVSFQANKKLPFFSWYKYKEGFAKSMVDYCLDDSNPSGIVFDPFAGSGAALFTANLRGLDSIGIELLPSGVFPIQARVSAQHVDATGFQNAVDIVDKIESFKIYKNANFGHVKITKGLFRGKMKRN